MQPERGSVRVGLMVEGQEGLTWERWQALAARAEALGFESFWRSDHLASLTAGQQRSGLEAWTSLAYLATATRRLRFGPLVSPITFRHPAVLASMAATVDVMSGGRLELGLGAAWLSSEHAAFGVPFPPPATRLAMLAEGIAVLKALWTDEPAQFDGRFYQLAGGFGAPKPRQRPHPPLVIGAAGERRALRLAAEHADEWNCYGTTPAGFRAKQRVLDEACRTVGRDPARLRRSVALPFVLGTAEPALQRHAARIQRLFPALVSDDAVRQPTLLRERGWAVGGPPELAAEIAAFAAEGASRVVLQHLDPEDNAALELVGSEVLPAVAASQREQVRR